VEAENGVEGGEKIANEGVRGSGRLGFGGGHDFVTG
jgi:hypothetical protein